MDMINEKNLEIAVLAGGCFWGMEDLIRKLPGVQGTRVGYAGGKTPNPTYKEVSQGGTGHAESIEIAFDPSKLSFRDLLLFFFKMHDPTTVNRQGNDIGTQYRSAIFATTESQIRVAREVIETINASRRLPAPIVTEVSAFSGFTEAEDYHQDYLLKNPGGYTCHFIRRDLNFADLFQDQAA